MAFTASGNALLIACNPVNQCNTLTVVEKKTRYTFRKEEHLCSRKAIESLMLYGKKINVFPLRLTWNISARKDGSPVQAAFSVSKKKFRKSVDRNRVKRLLRESYRQNKLLLLSSWKEPAVRLDLMLTYHGHTLPEFQEIREKIIVILQRLKKNFTEDVEQDHRHPT